MRADMYKVIVERPRKNRSTVDNGRIWRNNEERSGKVGIKRGYFHIKWLNENLAPLKRWLRKQIHRPWDAVYSELSQGIDRRNTVQAHIYSHIDDFVEQHTRLIDGVVCALQHRWSPTQGWVPVRQHIHIELFVHPITGILLPNRGFHDARRKQAEQYKLSNEKRRNEWQHQRACKEQQALKDQQNREEKYRPIRKKLIPLNP
jgi:hypothetical protein